MCDEHDADFSDLEELLLLWKLPQLVTHFKGEGININELEIMKMHHVAELLNPFKMCIRIRFEHHFEKWRRSRDKPLLQTVIAKEFNMRDCCSVTSSVSSAQPKVDNETQTSYETCAVDTDLIEALSSPSKSSSSTLCIEPICKPADLPRLRPQRRNIKIATPPTSPRAHSLFEEVIATMEPPTQPFKYYDVVQNGPVTLMQILNEAGIKGATILDYYNTHEELANSHRSLLIQLIINFFVENDYHLSLSTSYNLESQILKQFPTEKIEYYRNEKRGKIYVKFCNLKRYKRKPVNKRRRYAARLAQASKLARRTVPLTVADAPDGDDEYSMSIDCWPDKATMELQIKSENFGDDGYIMN